MKQFLTLYGFSPLLPIGIALQIIALAMNRCKSYADKHTSPDIAEIDGILSDYGYVSVLPGVRSWP